MGKTLFAISTAALMVSFHRRMGSHRHPGPRPRTDGSG